MNNKPWVSIDQSVNINDTKVNDTKVNDMKIK